MGEGWRSEGVPFVRLLTENNSRQGDRCLSNVGCHDNLKEVVTKSITKRKLHNEGIHSYIPFLCWVELAGIPSAACRGHY